MSHDRTSNARTGNDSGSAARGGTGAPGKRSRSLAKYHGVLPSSREGEGSGEVTAPGASAQNAAAGDGQGVVQRKAATGPADARAVAAAGSPASGRPLPESMRTHMETSFATDFSAVRVHQDGRADALGAVAFTRGNDLHFSPGTFDPGSTAGRELIGHELAHVVQQRSGRVDVPQGKGAPVNDSPALEAEADWAGARAARGEPAGISPAGAASGGAAAIQGYHIRTREQEGWDALPFAPARVSEDGTMAVPDSEAGGAGGAALQTFLATTGVFASARDTLDAIGSGFALTQDSSMAVTGPAPDGSGLKTLQRVVPSNRDQALVAAQMGTFRNCDENTRHGLGMQRGDGSNSFRQLATQVGDQQVPTMSMEEGNRATQVTGDVRERMLGPKQRTGWQKLWGTNKGPRTVDERNRAYETMGDEARDAKAAELGVNQFADVGVGEAFGVIGSSGIGHFAPVIAASGPDRVTLENDTDQVGGGRPENNTMWYFRMYGPVKRDEGGRVTEDQTFYGEQRRSGGYGAEPVVIHLVGIDVEPTSVEEYRAFKTRAAENVPRLTKDLPGLEAYQTAPTADATLLATLQAIVAAFPAPPGDANLYVRKDYESRLRQLRKLAKRVEELDAWLARQGRDAGE